MRIASKSFFNRPAPAVARDLVGCHLVRKIGPKTEKYMITETEAYHGFLDLASHASKGRTARNEIMFGPAGFWYVYFVYGMHWMLNVVTGKRGFPSAVLIRGITSAKGPARLTKLLRISGKLNGKPAGKSSGLWIEIADRKIPSGRIRRTARIGVDYAGDVWAKKKWGFVVEK